MKFRDQIITGSGHENASVAFILCEGVNDRYRQRAQDDYLKSNAHKFALLATTFTAACKKEIKNIKSGKPSPQPPFSCCQGCFVDLLTAEMRLTYPVLDTLLDNDDPAWDNVRFNDAPDESDAVAMEEFLIKSAHAGFATAYAPVNEDIDARNKYLSTLQNILLLSARLAKRVGEVEGGKDLLTAIGILQRESELSHFRTEKTGFSYMTKNEAAKLYTTATRGWQRLWAAVEYAALEPLPLKSTRRKA